LITERRGLCSACARNKLSTK